MRRSWLFLFLGASVLAQSGPPVVWEIHADAIAHSSLRLIWNNSLPINSIRARYGFTTSYDLGPGGKVNLPGTSSFSQLGQTLSLSGLQPDTEYHFCPQSSTDNGKSWSACVDFAVKLPPAPTVHPAPPQPPAEFDVSYPTQSGAQLLASPDCSNLQDLFNAARYGDTILIPPSTTCPGPYTLPAAPEALQFPASDVDSSTDEITLRGHPFADGQKVHLDTDGCLPGTAGEHIFCTMRPPLAGSDYVAQKVDADHIRLRKPDGSPITFGVGNFTADPLAGTFTIAWDGAVIYDGAPIQVRSTGALPGGLQPRVTYFVVNPLGSRVIRLAAFRGGPPLTISNPGQGTHAFTDPGFGTHAIMAWPPPADQAWIVVRTATPDDQFCPEGVRCLGEIWAPKMARIAQMTQPSGGQNDIRLNFGFLTHHWRFTGIEFTHADNSAAAATTSDPTPYYSFISTRRSTSYFILDRCYIHGLGAPNRVALAIEKFDGTNMAIINSDLEKLDFFHPSASPKGLMPSIPSLRTAQIAPGTFYMGAKSAALNTPLTVTISGSGSGTGIVYFDLDANLHVDLPFGVQGSCSQACVLSTASTSSPAYPVNASGQIAVAQITDLAIANGTFVGFAYRANYPRANRTEGAQSFIAGNGPGPFLIRNNTISGTGIPMHFDDSGGALVDRNDYVVRRNLFTAPLSQQYGGPQSDGLHYFHRNHLEWKGGQRILVEGNVFENNFADVTPLGAPLVITPVAGGYSTDIMIRNNTFRNNGAGIVVAAVDASRPASKPIERISVVNNLFHNNDGFKFNTGNPVSGITMYFGYSAADLKFDHNTLYDNRGYDPVALHLIQNPVEGVSFTNNFLWVNDEAGRKGIDGESFPACPLTGIPSAFLDCTLGRNNYKFARNVLMPGWSQSPDSKQAGKLLAASALRDAYTNLPDNWVLDGSTIESRLAQAGLSPTGDNFRHADGSLYSASGSRTGTDGKAIGADIDQLEAAQGLIGAASAAREGSSVAINVRVPDAGAACYVLYGQGKDVSNFIRTAADTSPGRQRTIRIESVLPNTTYNFAVLCNGASNSSSGSFSTF